MTSQQFRQAAWNRLKTNYGTGLVVCLIQIVIASVAVAFSKTGGDSEAAVHMSSSTVSLAISLLVTNPILVGISRYFTKAARENAEIPEMFFAFKNSYVNIVLTMFLSQLKIFLWSLLLIVPGIIKAYEYSMIPYILAENPDMNQADVFALSKKLMSGNKFRLFMLQLSFIGWWILCLFTCGIGFVFLAPYLNAAIAEFYLELKSKETLQATIIG